MRVLQVCKKIKFPVAHIPVHVIVFTLRACNIGNALGEYAVILSGILCNTYLPYLQTSSTSFHYPPHFVLFLPAVTLLYLRS